ncbi:MAG: dolichyl-phosphate beta-glucosyltransferase [Anaerolineae bacterium]
MDNDPEDLASDSSVHGAPRVVALSIVIPAHNEEERLPFTLSEIHRWVTRKGLPVEVIVVENGSTDGTARIVREFSAAHPYVKLIAGVPRGKGIAVREGMLAARGTHRFLCDADLSMPIDELDKFLGPSFGEADVAIGSREAAGSRRVGEPAYRHLMGRVYNLIVKLIALPGFEDTQCGFKMFGAEAADDVFRAARLRGWGFDPEVLYIARKRGYRIAEVPIEWHYNGESRVRPVHDTLAMLRELVAIRRNDRHGLYDA